MLRGVKELEGYKILTGNDTVGHEARVYVDLSREKIENSPEYDPSKAVARDYEEGLYAHYDRPRYWRNS